MRYLLAFLATGLSAAVLVLLPPEAFAPALLVPVIGGALLPPLLVMAIGSRVPARKKDDLSSSAKALSKRGQAVPAIAKRMRLSQDAVRGLLGANRGTKPTRQLPQGSFFRTRKPTPKRAPARAPRSIGTRCDVTA